MASLMETISDKLSLAIEKPSFRLSFSSYELKIFSFLKKTKNKPKTNKQTKTTPMYICSIELSFFNRKFEFSHTQQ